MSTTIATPDGYTIDSNDQTGAEMLADLERSESVEQKARIVREKGKDVEPDDKDPAAVALGSKGGKAAAEARKAKPIPDKHSEAAQTRPDEAETKEAKADDEDDDEARDEELSDRQRRRIEKATRKEAEAKRTLREAEQRHAREISETRARLEALERVRQQSAPDSRPVQPEARPQASKAPVLEEFLAEHEDYNSGVQAFVEARDKWNREEWTRETQRQNYAHAQASNFAAEVDSMVGGWTQALNRAYSDDPAFKERVKPVVARIPLPTKLIRQDGQGGWIDVYGRQSSQPDAANWISDDLMSFPDRAHSVLDYFAEHPQELERIASLKSPRAVTRELTLIESRLDATSGTPPETRSGSKPEVSKAKPPIPPVTGSPRVSDDPDDEDDYDTHVRKMNAKDRRSVRR